MKWGMVGGASGCSALRRNAIKHDSLAAHSLSAAGVRTSFPGPENTAVGQLAPGGLSLDRALLLTAGQPFCLQAYSH